MPKIKLYIAISLDGFIARKDNTLDWLVDRPNPNKLDYGNTAFYDSIDAVVMGRNTYNEILGFGVEWPYKNCSSFVVTRDANFKANTPNTTVVHSIDADVINQIRAASKKNIWLVGGGQLISSFVRAEAIDEMILTLVPTMLGSGLPLFPGETLQTEFSLNKVETFETDIVNLYYDKK